MARGDRVRVERRLVGSGIAYMHHGIDLGDGTVAHARPDDFRQPFAGGRVERTSLEEFAAGGAVRVTNDPPARFPPEEIISRALSQVGRPGYCPVVDNCEHFATWCATGERASRQADIVLSRIGSVAARVAAAVATRGLAAGAAGRVVVRTAVGTTVRVGLRTLVPAAVAGEALALAAEWATHHAGGSAAESRRAGEAAGLATSAVTCGLAGLAGGPAGVVTGALMGAAVWSGGSLVARAAEARTCGQRRSP